MDQYLTIQYQAHVEPVLAEPEAVTESRWHQPWSEPVRHRIAPALAIALVASGLFMTPTQEGEQINPDKWFAPLSEPVRQPVGLKSHLQQFFTGDTQQIASSAVPSWFAPLSEPVRLKVGLRTDLQQTFTTDTVFIFSPFTLMPYFAPLSEPVRLPVGLRVQYQKEYFGPDRLLPNPDVTATMAATETNLDVFLAAINVYDSGGSVSSNQGAKVSIAEVQVPGQDGMSIRES